MSVIREVSQVAIGSPTKVPERCELMASFNSWRVVGWKVPRTIPGKRRVRRRRKSMGFSLWWWCIMVVVYNKMGESDPITRYIDKNVQYYLYHSKQQS